MSLKERPGLELVEEIGLIWDYRSTLYLPVRSPLRCDDVGVPEQNGSGARHQRGQETAEAETSADGTIAWNIHTIHLVSVQRNTVI